MIVKLREWRVSSLDGEGARLMSFEALTYKTKIADWYARARAFIGELYLTVMATQQISRPYFDGHPILFSDRRECLDRLVEGLENVIQLYNESIGSRLHRYRIDIEGVKRAVQPHVSGKINSIVDRAKAETLFNFDEHDAAAAVLEPYIYGDQPEYVEICLDGAISSHGNATV